MSSTGIVAARTVVSRSASDAVPNWIMTGISVLEGATRAIGTTRCSRENALYGCVP